MDNKQIGRMLAAGGVILSLSFVGYELRQNNVLARATAYSDFMSSITESQRMLATDPILTPLLVRANQGEPFDNFKPVEQTRLLTYYMSNLRMWEGLYRYIQLGILPSDMLDMLGKGQTFENAFFETAWPFLRGTFTEDYGEFLETKFGSRQGS